MGCYRHFKGGLYCVIGMARHSESLEPVVVYQSMETCDLWVRPLTAFMLPAIDPNTGAEVPRFERLELDASDN